VVNFFRRISDFLDQAAYQRSAAGVLAAGFAARPQKMRPARLRCADFSQPGVAALMRPRNGRARRRQAVPARLAPAQGIGAEQKPAGFLLERIARFFCEAKKCAQPALDARRVLNRALPIAALYLQFLMKVSIIYL
jgi:hypothetical protein